MFRFLECLSLLEPNMFKSPNALKISFFLLFCSCFYEVTELLAQRKLAIDACDAAGWTALHVALFMGRRHISPLAEPNCFHFTGFHGFMMFDALHMQ